MRHTKCRIWVHFAGRHLPEEVRYGARINVVGKLRSFNVGMLFAVTGAYCMDVTPRAVMSKAVECLPDAIKDHWREGEGDHESD